MILYKVHGNVLKLFWENIKYMLENVRNKAFVSEEHCIKCGGIFVAVNCRGCVPPFPVLLPGPLNVV